VKISGRSKHFSAGVTTVCLFIAMLLFYWSVVVNGEVDNLKANTEYLPPFLVLALIDLVCKGGFVISLLKFTLPKFGKTVTIFRLSVVNIMLLIVCFVGEVMIKGFMVPGFHTMRFFGHIPLGLISLITYLIICSVVMISHLVSQWVANEKQKRTLIESQLTNELNFLKAQINPHFIFNSLNTLFSIAQKYNATELETGILKLSGLLRYSLYDNGSNSVLLKNEIKYIDDYIGLFKLRYPGEELTVHYTVSGPTENIMISPMLFLPFVENAFKYGVSLQRESVVSIDMQVKGDIIYFTCINDFLNAEHTYFGNSNGGLGLINVKRRLSLLYPHKSKLSIHTDNGKYTVLLEINTSL
jgi:sensor histidine kinase YesM